MRSVLQRLGAAAVFLALLVAMAYLAVQNRPSEPRPPNKPILYDQFNNASWWGVPGDIEGQGADDFVVPVGQTWVITQVEVSGIYFDTYFDGSQHGAQSVNVELYQDGNSLPGTQIAAQESLTYTLFPSDSTEGRMVATPATPDTLVDRINASFAIPVDPIALSPGTYWLSVWANMPNPKAQVLGGALPRWLWVARRFVANNESAFHLASGAGLCSCRTWGHVANCGISRVGHNDLVFRLRGHLPLVAETPTAAAVATIVRPPTEAPTNPPPIGTVFPTPVLPEPTSTTTVAVPTETPQAIPSDTPAPVGPTPTLTTVPTSGPGATATGTPTAESAGTATSLPTNIPPGTAASTPPTDATPTEQLKPGYTPLWPTITATATISGTPTGTVTETVTETVTATSTPSGSQKQPPRQP